MSKPTPKQAELDKIFQSLEYTVLNSQVSANEFKTEVWFNLTDEVKQALLQWSYKQTLAVIGEPTESDSNGRYNLKIELKEAAARLYGIQG